ncbi:MAG: outer membrane lipoprotein chaperone LolA [Acidobacteriota bacterium]
MLTSLAVIALGMWAGMQSPPEAATELAGAVQKRYATVRDFSADFMHSYRGGVFRTEAVERGKVVIKKPGKMRWEYTTPERKLFVSDGVRLYAYVPEDRQVTVSPVPGEDHASTSALFLAGRGDLNRDFVASLETAIQTPAGTLALKLTPRRSEAEYDWLVLVIDRASLQIRHLVTADAQGGRSTFVFSNLRENTNPADQTFSFTIPRGVDVITTDRIR